MSSPKMISYLKGNAGTITSIAFANNSENFIASSLDKTVTLYSVNDRDTRCLKFRYDFELYSCDFSNKNMLVACGNSKKIVVSELVVENGYQEAIMAHNPLVRSVHFSNSGNRFVIGDDKIIKMYRLTHHEPLTSFINHSMPIRCVKFSPSNNLIASCAEDKTLKIFDANNGSLIHSFYDKKGFGNALSWHKDNNTIAIAQENGRMKIFDVAQRKMIQFYRIFECSVKCLDFHPSGNFMITGDENGLSRIFDLQAGQDLFTVTGHQGPVTAVKFSKDGKYFVTGSEDRHIMIFKSNLVDNYSGNNQEVQEAIGNALSRSCGQTNC